MLVSFLTNFVSMILLFSSKTVSCVASDQSSATKDFYHQNQTKRKKEERQQQQWQQLLFMRERERSYFPGGKVDGEETIEPTFIELMFLTSEGGTIEGHLSPSISLLLRFVLLFPLKARSRGSVAVVIIYSLKSFLLKIQRRQNAGECLKRTPLQ